MKTRDMKKMTKVGLALAALGLGACGLDIPDLNRPSVSSLENTPTRSAVLSAAVGLEVGGRVNIATQNGYVSMLGILGRESYVLDRADPRYVGEMLAGASLDPGSPAFGGNFWTAPYANIRNGTTLLNALEKVEGVSAEEKQALRGFTKTLQALDFLVLINTHDTNGAVIDVSLPLGSPLAPIEGKVAVFAHIVNLLDEGKGHLEGGGSQFPFVTSSGLTRSVPEFKKFNRALKARVDVYKKDWDQALVDLGESFIDPAATTLEGMNKGFYYAFGTGSGDSPNELRDPDIYVHPSIRAGAELQPGGAIDDRVSRKITPATPNSWQGVTGSDQFILYNQGITPVPIIRNEELLLIRAEAYLGRNRAGDADLARADLNTVRRVSGKLGDLPAGGDLVSAMLKERRYSLLFEGGHRWIDARRYEKLEELPKDVAGHRVHSAYPIPTPEVNARL